MSDFRTPYKTNMLNTVNGFPHTTDMQQTYNRHTTDIQQTYKRDISPHTKDS